MAGILGTLNAAGTGQEDNFYAYKETLKQLVYLPLQGFGPKTRGGTLEAPAYREENFAVAGKLSIFENTARKGLPKSTQMIAENSLGLHKH